MNKFEQLLNGRAIEDLSEEELEELIAQLNANDIEKFERMAISKKPQRRSEKKLKEVEDMVNAAILKGLRK